MPAETPATPEDWRRLHAFGWPAGSVRALMALVVFGTLWALLVLRPDLEVPGYLNDLLFIILGHYFAVRGRQDGGAEPGPSPLYLPRGAVRFLLIGGFVASAVLLHRQGKLAEFDRSPAVATLLLVAGFVLGVVLRQVWVSLRGEGRPLPRIIEDLRAFVSLAAAVFLAVLVWDQFLAGPPRWGLSAVSLGLGKIGLPHVTSAVVGFYFGSRS